MKINKILLIVIAIVTAQSAYTATGYLKLIVNKNPEKYKVNVQGDNPHPGYIRFKSPGWSGATEHRDWQEEFPADMDILDYIDYSVPKGTGNGRLFILVYDRKTNQRVHDASILDLGDSVIQIEGRTKPSSISSKNHNIAFRAIVEEDGTVNIAE